MARWGDVAWWMPGTLASGLALAVGCGSSGDARPSASDDSEVRDDDGEVLDEGDAGGEEDDDEASGDDDDDASGDDDNDIPALLPLSSLFLGLEFGYDAESDETVEVTSGNVPLPGTARVRFGAPGWTGDLAAIGQYCTITLDIGFWPGDAAVAAARGDWWGFQFVGATGTHDCDHFDYEPRFGTDLVAVFGTHMTWSVSVGPIDPVVEASLVATYGSNDHYVGGYLALDFDIHPIAESPTYMLAYGIDPSYELELDASGDPILLLESDIPTATGIKSGHYVVHSWHHFML